MATYTTTESVDASSEEIQEMMVAKAHELFSVCDKEEKGFITKRDMQRLQTELPLSPEQLEDVFDSLDDDGNGYLTLEEFTEGFGSFLGLTPSHLEKQASLASTSSGEHIYENEHIDSDDHDSDHFEEMVSHVGAQGIFEDVDTIKSLWNRLRKDEPELLGNFEEFLSKVTGEIKRSHQDFQTLESALRNKSSSHDEEVRKLYEEMEQQIKLEKERVVAEEKARERSLRDEMERELHEKDTQLQDMLRKHAEMEARLQELNSTEMETKQENDRLAKEKDELQESLNYSMRHLEDSKTYVSDLKTKQRSEKRERVMAALQISEGIALERESLVKQLDMLREMNKKLRDERDEADLRRKNGTLQNELEEVMNGERAGGMYGCDTCDSDAGGESISTGRGGGNIGGGGRGMSRTNSVQSTQSRTGGNGGGGSESGGPARKPLNKQGSVLSEYFSSPKSTRRGGGSAMSVEEDDDDDIECDDDLIAPSSYGNLGQHAQLAGMVRHSGGEDEGEEDDEVDGEQRYPRRPVRRRGAETSDSEMDEDFIRRKSAAARLRSSPNNNNSGESSEFDTSTPRREPLGAQAVSTVVEVHEEDLTGKSPERVFKVVFVGDSGVGKSSFIHRFCNNEFKATFSATIGVDFAVRNLRVDGHIIALQLWDTAGQERFRSITKQYFRKADGVLIMYDVTSESSYKNVRNWMISVQDGVEEGTVLTLVGNKMDLVEDEDGRPVKTKDGVRLADECGALFYETSAKSGSNVPDTLMAMASLLREREDKQLENALNLAEDSKKKGCCS